MSELESRAAEACAFGEIYVAFPDVPGSGPRLRLIAAPGRVLVTVALLALVDARESPWAEIREAGRPGDGDPYGYRGAVLAVEADSGTVTYRIGEYMPAHRSYVAERAALAVELDVVRVVDDGPA